MSLTIKTLKRKISVCLFVEDWHESLSSWMIDDWCSFFSKNFNFTIPFYETRVIHNINYRDLIKRRGALTSDPSDDLFLSDICIGYDSIYFSKFNTLKQLKAKNLATVLCIKSKSLSNIESSAIASSLVDQVWVLDYLYSDNLINEILSVNFSQNISIIEDCYKTISISNCNDIVFVSRKDDVTDIKISGLLAHAKSVSSHPVHHIYFSDFLINRQNNEIMKKYNFYVFYNTDAADCEELRIIDYVSKYKNAIVNDFGESIKKMYRTYNSKEEIEKFIVNNDKEFRKTRFENAISFQKAIFDMIQRR